MTACIYFYHIQKLHRSSGRSSSADSYGRFRLPSKHRRLANKDGDILYKIEVTTGDIKNSGTDAKVHV